MLVGFNACFSNLYEALRALRHCFYKINTFAVADQARDRCAYTARSTATNARWAQTPAATCQCQCQCLCCCVQDRTADDWGMSEVSRCTRPLWTRVEWTVEPRATTINSHVSVIPPAETALLIDDWCKSYNVISIRAMGYEMFKAFWWRLAHYEMVLETICMYMHVFHRVGFVFAL